MTASDVDLSENAVSEAGAEAVPGGAAGTSDREAKIEGGNRLPGLAASPLKVLGFLRTSDTREALLAAVNGGDGMALDLRLGSVADVGEDAIRTSEPDALLVDIDAEDPTALASLDALMEAVGAAVPVIATSDDGSLHAVRHLMRRGVADFVPQPFVREDIVEAIEGTRRRGHHRPRDQRAGRVLTFIKACGGVGTTTLALHAALSLAGKAKAGAGVTFLDLDLQFGSGALYLDLGGGPGVMEILRDPDRLDPELLRGAMATHKSGLDLLAAPDILVPLEAFSAEFAGRLLSVARTAYKHVVIDMPRDLASWCGGVLSGSDAIVLVTQLSVPGVRQARRLLDILQAEQLDDVPLYVALNRYEKSWRRGVGLKEAERGLGRSFDFIVPNDFKLVGDALNRGVPVYDVKRRSRFEAQIRQMVDAYLRDVDHAAEHDGVAAGKPA